MLFSSARKITHSLALVGLAGLGSAAAAQEAAQSTGLPEGLSTQDWSEIEAARDAYRYRVTEVSEGHQARNVGQAWTTRFDGQGFLVRPDQGSWSWGLELESYGFGGDQLHPHEIQSSSASNNRFTYNWGAGLEEWFINDARGLEHGYTLHERPVRSANLAGALTFQLAVKGSLQAKVAAGGTTVRFLDELGATTVTYGGLHVFDANGVTQVARFQGSGDQVLITINEATAKYPLTIDPIAQVAYLKASNTGQQDHFGSTVAISGDLAVVSSVLEDSDATGVDGDQLNNNAANSGAV